MITFRLKTWNLADGYVPLKPHESKSFDKCIENPDKI